MASPLRDETLEALLDRLHAESDAQAGEINAHFAKRVQEGTLRPGDPLDHDLHRFLSDKMVALDRDKAELCYLLCRAPRRARGGGRHLVRRLHALPGRGRARQPGGGRRATTSRS
ncbi:MAG: hypothetical protein QNK04_25970 [Myxococcota bacterium]|nr:hypothetical protein [Myxococcota bacterium]